MRRLRLLVVDPAPVMRLLIGQVCGGDPGIDVVGTAGDIAAALGRIPLVRPDLILIDPGEDRVGLTALHRAWPELRLVVFHHGNPPAGGMSRIAKPHRLRSVAALAQWLRSELVPVLLEQVADEPHADERLPAGTALHLRHPPRLILIAAGQSDAATLGQLLALLTEAAALGQLPAPVAVVSHMPAPYLGLLAERLARRHQVRADLAATGDRLLPGRIAILSGDCGWTISARGDALLVAGHPLPPELDPIGLDQVLVAAVRALGPRLLVAVLGGEGADGLRGCAEAHAAGACVLVERAACTDILGLPAAVAEAGLADARIAADELAHAVLDRFRSAAATEAQELGKTA